MNRAAATPLAQDAQLAYDAMADCYDVFTAGYDHERWLGELERIAMRHGLAGRRVLDVACGTGRSFLPMLRRGYEVVGCDVSARMLAHARLRAPEVLLRRIDMRELPVLGAFDLITCLDDALNYVLELDELRSCLAAFARNLAPGGLAIWDLNTVAQYQGQFARDQIVDSEGLYVGWRPVPGRGWAQPGDLVDVAVTMFARDEDGGWDRRESAHRQRHWTPAAVVAAAESAGLGIRGIFGQRLGVRIDDSLDELVHAKALYVAAVR